MASERASQLAVFGVSALLFAASAAVTIVWCASMSAMGERVLGEVKARYVTGLTATPYRRDGHQPIIHMQCGPSGSP